MVTGSRAHGARVFVIDTVVVAVTQMLLRVRGLVLLPLIVNVLGTEAYGIWAQVLSLATFLSALVCLNFHLPLVREVAADRARGAEVYTTLFLATLGFSGAVVAALALVPGPMAAALLDQADAGRFILLALALMLVNNVRLLNTNLYRATGKLAWRSGVELTTAVGEIALAVVVLRAGGSLDQLIGVVLIWNGAIAVLQTAHCFALVGWARPRGPIVRAAVAYALPLIPVSFANFALDRIDRFFIGYFHGATAVGIYSANYAIGALVLMAQTPFQITLLPKVAELWERDRAEAARYIQVSMLVFLTLGIPFVLGIPLVAKPLLTLLGNREIGASAASATFLIAAGVLAWGVAITQAQIFYGARRTSVWGALTIGATALNVVLNLILVPPLGIEGAAIATLASYAALAVAAVVLSRPVLAIGYDLVQLGVCVAAAGLMCGFLWLMAPARPGPLLATLGAAGLLYLGAVAGLGAVLPGARTRPSLWQVMRSLRRR